jgi:hypothetical protein
VPATFLLVTADTALHAAWSAQLGPDRATVPWGDVAARAVSTNDLATVVVLDALEATRLPVALTACPTVLVGEPHTTAYEQLRLSGRARVTLTYEESRR